MIAMLRLKPNTQYPSQYKANINTPEQSVATCLRCGEIFSDHFIQTRVDGA